MRDCTRLDAGQKPPQRTRHRSHTVRTRRDVNVLAQVPNPVYGADHRRRSRTEELDEVALLRRLLDLAHRYRAFGYD